MWMDKKIEFEISGYRIELRCSIYNGLIRWWDDEPTCTTQDVEQYPEIK
jgi:hypothetical protein